MKKYSLGIIGALISVIAIASPGQAASTYALSASRSTVVAGTGFTVTPSASFSSLVGMDWSKLKYKVEVRSGSSVKTRVNYRVLSIDSCLGTELASSGGYSGLIMG